MYAEIAHSTGWTIPHIREELDLPTLISLREQWAQFPPVPVMVAHYLGAAKPKHSTDRAARLEDQDAIPTTRMSATEFDGMLVSMGLPTAATQPSTATPKP